MCSAEPPKVRWPDFIASDPEVLGGKPVVRGTRLAVDFVLGLFAAGWTQQQVLDNYRSLTPEALRAVFAYAAEVLGKENLIPVRSRTA
jgi:uncharacterized protein (DUF433 family)